MQNFTLGKKGISMLFLTFILLIGSLPSYGQTCPTTDGTVTPQNFCYLQTVGDIETDGDAIFQTSNVTTDTQPIPVSEILESGIYYAGSSTGTCARIAITVNVTAEEYPDNTLYPGSTSFSISPCLNTDFTAEDLAGFFNAEPDYSIRVYQNQFGTELATGQLEPNDSYFVGQVYTGEGDASANCPSLRVAVGYNPANAPAPTAASPQVFCEGATVADLQAQGTSPFTQAIRWYRTDDSFQPLADNTLLISGVSYYASQIINDRNDPFPPCESEDRAKVDVTINPPVDLGTPVEGTICDSDVQETFPSFNAIENYYLSLLPAGTPTNGTFNPTAAALAQQYQNDEDGLGSFTTVYTVGVEGCESSVELTATVVADEEANAGTIEPIVVDCGSEEIVILDDTILSADASTGGTFSGEGLNEDGNFDPSIGPGNYIITYSVDDSADCVIEGTSDETTFTITVQGSDVLIDTIVMEMCVTEVQGAIETPADFEAYFNNILEENGITNIDGTFDPSENVVGTAIFTYINSMPTAPATFNTTYTVTSACGEESVDITLTINNLEEPNAGTITPAPVCASATLFDLNSLLGEDNDAGGNFSVNGNVIENSLFDVSEAGNFEITYSVTESVTNCTEGEPDSTVFTLVVGEGIVAESPEPAIVCESDVQTLFPSVDEIRKFYVAIAQQAGFPTNGTISPNGTQLAAEYQADEDGLGDFTTTYTFGEGDCQTSVELTVTIVPAEDAEAGTIENITVDCNDEELINLASLPNNGGNTGGTFSGEGVTNGNFDPSIGPGTYTITYMVDDAADCVNPGTSDETTFTITVQSSFDLGEPIAMEMCITEVQALILNPGAALTIFTEELENRGIETVEGTFTPGLETVAGQIAAFLSAPTASQTFETTFSVSTECGDDSVLISLTINNTVAPDAGVITPAPVCASATPFDLNSLLGNDNNPGGTFSDENGDIEGGLYDVSQSGSFDITYTVSASAENCTAGDDSSTEFTLTVTEGTVAQSPAAAIVCLADVQTLFPSNDEVRKYYVAIAQRAGFPTNGTLSPTVAELVAIYQNDEDGLGDFTTTYSFGEGDCQTSVELTVRIVESVNAGTDGTVTLEEDDDAVNLFDYLGGNPDQGGTWSSGNGMFDPATDEPGTYTYTVGTDSCSDSATVTVTVTTDPTDPTDPCAVGTPTLRTICAADVQTIFPSIDEIRKYYLSLLDAGVATTGTFNPTAAQLATQYQNDADGLGDFSTTYTLTGDDCTASVLLTVRIAEDVNAGTDGTVTLNEDDDAVNLFESLGGNPTEGGTWNSGNGMFDPATDAPGVYTYTVGSDSCVDSATVTVTVTTDPTDPTECEGVVDAGDDNSVELCNADVISLSDGGVRNLFLGLLEDGVPTTGTFNPTISELITQYNTVSRFGDFTTTYTVVDGDCSDSVVLTVTVIEANDAGDDMNITFCTTQGTVNLFDYLSPLATTNGTFIGYANGTFDPATATVGETTITYEVEEDDSVCSRDNFTSTFTITVTEPQAANAGGDVAATYCVDQDETIQLTSLLGEGAILTGTFSAPFANGSFNPSTAGVGVYPITYTVAGNCIIGTATATVTVTVQGTSEAPVAEANQSFCLVDNPTVADLVAEGAEGAELIWYSDEALETVVPATTALVNNAVYYVVSSTGDTACETSEAVMVTVTLNTEVSPTIQLEGNEFCRQDSPTVQDLIANLDGTAIRIYNSATGGTSLAGTEALVDGVIYYATSTNATTGCESSERRAINVEVGFCGIPEGFSPNGDEKNDRFEIPDIAENYPNYTIEIFNRWGNVVFKGNANTPDWDGVSNQSTTLGDKVLPAGVYFYIVNYNDGSTPPVQGKLYLSR